MSAGPEKMVGSSSQLNWLQLADQLPQHKQER